MFGYLYGHSYVSRLARYLRVSQHSSPFQIANRIRVSDLCRVALKGIPGARVHYTSHDDIINSLDEQEPIPHFVVLDLGTNDLLELGALVLATRLFDLAEKLVASGVWRVVICQVLHRGMGRAPCVTSFNADVDLCNKILKTMAEGHPNISLHPHKGVHTLPVYKWSDDGLHPHLYKYLKSVRLALQRVALSCQVPHSFLCSHKTCACIYS